MYIVRSAAGTSVSLCACERVTSDFQGIARVGKLRSSKKNTLIRSAIFVRPNLTLDKKKQFNARDKK